MTADFTWGFGEPADKLKYIAPRVFNLYFDLAGSSLVLLLTSTSGLQKSGLILMETLRV